MISRHPRPDVCHLSRSKNGPHVEPKPSYGPSWLVTASMTTLAYVFGGGGLARADEAKPTAAQTTPPMAPGAQNAERNTCSVLSISQPKTSRGELGSFLKSFERAVESNDAASFLRLLHPAIIKEPSEKHAIFKNMMANYEFEGKTLQRRFLYELSVQGTSQQVRCSDHEVTAVVGPKEQWATEYSSTNAGEQARLFVLIGRVPESLRAMRAAQSPQAGEVSEFGIVHIHTQNWSFAGQTPESLFASMRKWNILGEPIAAWAFGTAARRIARSNGYLYDTGFDAGLADHDRIKPAFEDITKPYRKQKIPETEFTVQDFTTIFRERDLAIGVKVETNLELAVNAQIENCQKVARHLLPIFVGAAKVLKGTECMIYRPGEDLAQAPSSGSIFVSFKDLVKIPAK